MQSFMYGLFIKVFIMIANIVISQFLVFLAFKLVILFIKIFKSILSFLNLKVDWHQNFLKLVAERLLWCVPEYWAQTYFFNREHRGLVVEKLLIGDTAGVALKKLNNCDLLYV